VQQPPSHAPHTLPNNRRRYLLPVKMPRAELEPVAPLRTSFAASDLVGAPPGALDSAAEAARIGSSSVVSGQMDRWALARWAGAFVLQNALCAALGRVVFGLYFGTAAACDSVAEASSRNALHWFVGLLPTLGRMLLIGVALFVTDKLCKCAGMLSEEASTGSLGRSLLFGAGGGDGDAASAGWHAIVGGGTVPQAGQATWAEARRDRKLTKRQAKTVAALKFVFWHSSQPIAYMWLLAAYRCYVADLGPDQQRLAAVVAVREILYLGTTILAVKFCPVFLLLDLKTVWNEAETPLQRFTRIAMYLFCPHNFVALTLSKRFPQWVRVFLVLAFVQVLADVSSCYALVYLIASNQKFHDTSAVNASIVELGGGGDALQQDIVPLQIGYSITSFGFLLFFGPLSIVSSLQGALDTQRHKALRAAKGLAGGVLATIWGGIMVLLVWLLFFDGSPLCALGLVLGDPCSSHGHCFGAAQCTCDTGYGPESKLSGTDLCSCKFGFIDENQHCDHPTGCDTNPYCGSHGTCVAVGANYTCACGNGWSGEMCDHPTGCDSKPCQHGGTCTANGGSHTCQCTSHRAGAECACAAGWDGAACNRSTGCDSAPACGHGTCVADGASHSCKCDKGWKDSQDGQFACSAGTGCDTKPCGEHAKTCNAVGSDHECICKNGWTGDQICGQPTGCDADPCGINGTGHGASCTPHGARHHCTCKGEWSGDKDCLTPPCETHNDCGPHGTCEEHDDDPAHTCNCRGEWSGSKCLVGPCEVHNTCGTHGTCRVDRDSHSCTCKSGWEGVKCDQGTGCVGHPCKHGGSCTANGGDHSCACEGGWFGEACEHGDTVVAVTDIRTATMDGKSVGCQDCWCVDRFTFTRRNGTSTHYGSSGGGSEFALRPTEYLSRVIQYGFNAGNTPGKCNTDFLSGGFDLVTIDVDAESGSRTLKLRGVGCNGKVLTRKEAPQGTQIVGLKFNKDKKGLLTDVFTMPAPVRFRSSELLGRRRAKNQSIFVQPEQEM
jgi:hypothetical protein